MILNDNGEEEKGNGNDKDWHWENLYFQRNLMK